MMKINNKGFVLAEMLIVTLFLMVIFSMLYANFYPLLAEYEIRENYDNVDSKYAVYWIKKIIEDNSYDFNDTDINSIDNNGYVQFSCAKVATANEKRNTCKSLVNSLEVANCNSNGANCLVYITKYQITDFKSKVKADSSTFSPEFQSYINTLPDFKTPSLNNAKYRVITVFKHKEVAGQVNSQTYNSYSTIEVRR